MKVLISAIACNPYLGSENYFGWAAVKALAQDHELWVLVGQRSQSDLTRATAEGLIPPNVHFIFAGDFRPWHANRMRARLQGWREYLHFSEAILPLAQRLHATENFDLVHHVTYATWRVATPLWRLGIPFVFGPIGGYEQFPAQLLPMLSTTSAVFELARMTSNLVSRFSPGVRRSLRQAAHVFVANPETGRLVNSVRGDGDGVSRLLPGFYSAPKVAAFARFAPDKILDGPLRLFAAGNMEGRKGVALALAALARAKHAGVKFHYRLGAGGPEIARLKKLAARLGLAAEVEFAENLHGEDYQRELGRTHVFLLPSLRESAGLTMMEAMLAGCVPVVADCGSPSFIVTDECGFRIPVASQRRMVAHLADALIAIDRDREIIRQKGRAASRRIADGFTEEAYRATVNAVYRSLKRI
jgi:glycosyltransferase involved in cell wall biosynthesis